MIIKTQRPINFINTCKCIVDYKELEKAIIWYSTYPVASTKKIYLLRKGEIDERKRI